MMNRKEQKNIGIIKYQFIVFFVFFAVIFVYVICNKPTELRHDALDYYTTGDMMWIDGGGISLKSFPNTFRGYYAYFSIMLFKHIFGRAFHDGYYGWAIYISLMISLTSAYALPNIFGYDHCYFLKNYKDLLYYYARQIVFLIILLYFWGNSLKYPMSDWLACAYLLTGIGILKDKRKNCVSYLLSGMMLYAAYNIRSVYMYTLVLLGLWQIIRFVAGYFGRVGSLNLIRRCSIIRLACFLGGMILVATPQIVINQKYNGNYSPLVPTEQYAYSSQVDLKEWLLLYGINHSRYETYVGDFEDYKEAGVRFIDKTGQRIIDKELPNETGIGIVGILSLIKKYPLDMLGIYTRHVVSAITPVWNQLYIQDLNKLKPLTITIGIMIWFVAGLSIFSKSYNCKMDDEFAFQDRNAEINCRFQRLEPILYSIFFVIPGFLEIIGGVEIRYIIMVYILLYFYVCIIADYTKLKKWIKKNIFKCIVWFAIIYSVWIAIIGDILSMNEYTTMVINGR